MQPDRRIDSTVDCISEERGRKLVPKPGSLMRAAPTNTSIAPAKKTHLFSFEGTLGESKTKQPNQRIVSTDRSI